MSFVFPTRIVLIVIPTHIVIVISAYIVIQGIGQASGCVMAPLDETKISS